MPCVYVLLPNKAQQIYNALFNELSNMLEGFNPTSIMTDSERTAINVLENCFATSHINVFFFT